jgi:hypothetical protein
MSNRRPFLKCIGTKEDHVGENDDGIGAQYLVDAKNGVNETRQTPGSPAEINFLRRLRKICVVIRSVLSFYCFMFHSRIKVDYCLVACISHVGQSFVAIGV